METLHRSQIAVTGLILSAAWRTYTQRHEFWAALCPDDEAGGFTAFAINYPGVVSEGDTLDEAKANIAEAFAAMLHSRRNHGESMLYSGEPVMEIPNGAVKVRIAVDG